MTSDNTQHKLSRIRKPRVQITYDLEIGNATEKKELPLVIGIIADLLGHNKPAAQLKERKFTEIEKANFDLVMNKMSPQLNLTVENKLKGTEGEKREFNLTFEKMEDFNPGKIVLRTKELNDLLQRKKSLLELINKIDTNDKLHNMLLEVSKDSTKVQTLIAKSEGNAAESAELKN